MAIRDFIDDTARSVAFLSRVPVPQRHFTGHDGRLSRAVRAFPLAGVLIALPAAALAAVLSAIHAPPALLAFAALALQVLVTGALHEDGLSDSADGIGGGRDRDSALAIMKDSRVGSYGAVALILSFGLRASAIAALATVLTPSGLGMALLAVAAGSTLRAGRPPRAVHVGIVVGAVVLWVMALAMLFVTIQSGSPAIVMPNGPGLWSIVGAPAFTVLATRIRGAYPATGTGRDAA